MNAGTNAGCVGDLVTSLTVLDEEGRVRTLDGNDAGFAYRSSALDGMVVLAARLSLEAEDPGRIAGRTREMLVERKRSQPTARRTAGCIFRNPRGASAGALIDRCGLKGMRVGGAYVSRKHANWVINDGTASAADVLQLIERVGWEVLERTGILLEREICVWP